MKIKKRILLALPLFFAANAAFSDTVTMDLTIINNTERTFNIVNDKIEGSLGPIVERNGGRSDWKMDVSSDVLTTLTIYYSAAYSALPCSLAEGSRGVFALNPALYRGDKITVTVTDAMGSEGMSFPICSCKGSACDVGFSSAQSKS